MLLEAATFDGPTILDTSLRLGLRSESSSRFEKGLPRELPARAMAVACRLLVELVGRAPGPGDPRRPRADRRPAAGDDAPRARAPRPRHRGRPGGVRGDPGRLGLHVVQALPDALTVRVPFERGADLTREIDLIEEVARIHGLDAIPALPRVVGRGRRSPAQALEHRLEPLAADLGLSEAVTYRQVPEADPDALRLAAGDPRRPGRDLAHPMSGEMAVMRRSMLPGLLRAVARNQAHQRADGGLFEIGRTYAPREDGLADERNLPGGGAVGRRRARGLARHPRRPADVHTGLATTLARRRRRRPHRAAAERRAVLPPRAPGPAHGRGGPGLGRRGAPPRAARLRRGPAGRRARPRPGRAAGGPAGDASNLRGPAHGPGLHARPGRRRARDGPPPTSWRPPARPARRSCAT